MPTLADNAKKAKIKLSFKLAFFQYQDQEVGIKATRILKQNENVAETQADNNDNNKLSDTELYRTGPLKLETETKLTRYLKLLVIGQETNIYHYQQAKQYKFPIISKIAADFLAIPATSAPSECVFSVSSDIVTKKRNRLTGESVQMIMCLKDQGIITDDDIAEDKEQKGVLAFLRGKCILSKITI